MKKLLNNNNWRIINEKMKCENEIIIIIIIINK
jgi:tRNA A22 N-methylase